MSSFIGKAINPATKKIEKAFFIDDFYGKHRYGVQFSDGKTYPEEEITTIEELK